MSDYARLNAISNRVRRNPQPDECRWGLRELNEAVRIAEADLKNAEGELKQLRLLVKKAGTPMAELTIALNPPAGYETVAVFDCDDVGIYYENEETDDMIEVPWPFKGDTIWPDDCVALDIRVE